MRLDRKLWVCERQDNGDCESGGWIVEVVNEIVNWN